MSLRDTEMDIINIKIKIIILEVLKIMNLMEKEFTFLVMDSDLKVFLKIQKNKDLGVYNIRMGIYIRVNFLMIRNTEKELKFTKIKLSMWENIIKTKKMEMGNLLINPEIVTMVNSKVVYEMI